MKNNITLILILFYLFHKSLILIIKRDQGYIKAILTLY